jgi:hypothetical protein
VADESVVGYVEVGAVSEKNDMSDVYTVHSAVIEPVMVPVTLEGGTQTMGSVPCLVVELVPQGIHGSVTRRYFIGKDEDRDALLDKYHIGAEVELTSEVVGEGEEGYPEEYRERQRGAAQPLHKTEEEPPAAEVEPAQASRK